MAEEILDLETLDQDIENSNKVEKRIKDLSEKVRMTSEERDESKRLVQEQMAKNSDLQRERDFFSGFADVVSANPAAKDHKDDILAKVKSGYTVEDATFAVLGKAGKLSGQVQPKVPEVENPVGGAAAATQPIIGGLKSVSQMSREEKRAQLLEAEARGDLYIS